MTERIVLVKNLFFGNLRAKSMAVIMAIALWFYAINKHNGDINEDLQLTINAPSGLTIMDYSSGVVSVGLSGPRNLIDRVSDMVKDNKIKARIDIPDIKDVEEDNFKRTIRLTRRNFNFPQEIRVNSIVPNEIDITLGRLDSKYIKVQVQKKGSPALGYEITSEFFYPREVLVTGPVNILKVADTISTNLIDVSRLTNEQNRTFPWVVELQDEISVLKNGKYVSVPVQCDERINVWFQITEKMESKIFDQVKINVFHPVNYDYRVKLKEEFISITLKGSKLKLDMLDSEGIMAYIDVTSLSPPGPYNQRVMFNIPEGLVIEGNPPESHVDIVETVIKQE